MRFGFNLPGPFFVVSEGRRKERPPRELDKAPLSVWATFIWFMLFFYFPVVTVVTTVVIAVVAMWLRFRRKG